MEDLMDIFREERQAIARAYANAPVHDKRRTRLWLRFAEVNARLAKYVRRRIEVEVVPYAPYQDSDNPALEQYESVQATGKLLISGVNNEHPVWTPEQNADYRTIHNWGHLELGRKRDDVVAGFDYAGERLACGQHNRLLLPYGEAVIRANITETLGQVAFRLEYGYYGEQKVALII